ncbi:hypothetical protein CH333_05925 [candidate division WOR-3 bacterium JGI_Cruoil_03_44_89]|uniref:histidine kinase n=1 Tax=candidate division WOR-3 bacterium JGI_Cruoil_03_44_89 TaxID=1973748 RepID=A0A235BSY9_UNCW3|nr:MAG: hypothetical protein CH333_05925 [candidate division WOR-3 bacterium JGI_Cruoil_03_44_89]
MKEQNPSIIKELSVSYECALAIGNSLDLSEMLHEVIYTIVHKTDAHYGIIWFGGEKGKGFQAIASAGIRIKDVLAQKGIASLQKGLKRILKKQQFVLKKERDKDFLRYCAVLTGEEESVLIIPIDNVAVIHLAYTGGEIVDESLVNLLVGLSRKLCVAIDACIAHENIVKEVRVRKEVVKQLRSSGQQYHMTIDAIGRAVHVVDRRLNITLFNETFRQWVRGLGMGVENIIGRNLFDLFPFLQDGVRDEYQRVIKTGKLLVTVETNEFAGRKITTETRKIPILDGGRVTRIVTVIEDITVQKKAEEELRKKTEQLISSQKELKELLTESEESRRSLLSILEDVKETQEALQISEERFQDIVVNTGDWIWETDEKGCYNYCSPVVKQVLGYECDEVLGKYFYDFFDPDEREESKKAAFEIFKKKTPFKNFVNRNVHKNGHVVILETSGFPMLDDRGNLRGYRGVDRDITERKQMEETIRESLHRSELLLDLMSHDLTNMNQMSLSSLELMLRGNDLSERVRRYSKLALGQIQRSARLISNVKKLTALRKEKPHFERLDIEPILENAISHLGEDFPQRDVEVNFKSQKEKWFVNGSGELLYDLFYNILHNAVKFDRHEKVIVDVEVSPNDGFWRLETRDRGPGIPDERKETIFLRARWRDKIIYGLGLGLALAEAIAQRHGGRIWVEDRVRGKTEEGSNFVVLLPKAINN